MKKGINKKLDHYRIVLVSDGKLLANMKYDYDVACAMFDNLVKISVTDQREKDFRPNTHIKMVEYKNGIKVVIKEFKN